jgi:hypothetical protein
MIEPSIGRLLVEPICDQTRKDGLSASRIGASNKYIQPQDAGVLAVLFALCFRPGLDFVFVPGLAFLQVD